MPELIKHYSPLRYPGGKSWLAPELREWLAKDGQAELVELFAGGAYASLLAVLEGYVHRATLVEVDPAICAVWRTVFSSDARKLCSRIRAFRFTEENVEELLDKKFRTDVGLAFQTIVKNRARRGGILADGAGILRAGERNKGLASRWYPQTLIDRIGRLNGYAENFKVIEGDALEYLALLNRRRRPVKLFVDPPYTKLSEYGVKPLYRFNHIDHAKLFGRLHRTSHDVLITYDDSDLVRKKAMQHEFDVKRILMRTAHSVKKYELLLTRR
ncbi:MULTISPECIES: DNA adenine methylase [Burkholderia]|uniref:DNA adenine methylase n=1 Tax=Burkholderia TaxID=32008 RepID=UPI0012FBB5AB|nr:MULTISPECIES: DNA adenine methylase [Burkholderia]MWA29953.1 DNA adenine methylase [Burkholderia pseudomallei]